MELFFYLMREIGRVFTGEKEEIAISSLATGMPI